MCKLCRNCEGYESRRRKRRPRFQRRKKRLPIRKVQKKQKTKLQVKKNVLKIHAATQSLPVPPKALSSLCEKYVPPSRTKEDLIEHSEITPQMIHLALKELSLLRDFVELDKIFAYILSHYPVNKNKKRLKAELIQKLQIAQLAGMVCSGNFGCYRLHSSLEGLRQIPKTVVALFWEIYCNTMDPLRIESRRGLPGIDPNEGDKDSDSDSPPDENLVYNGEENSY